MKKFIILIVAMLFITGCTSENDTEEEILIDEPYINFISDTFILEWGSDFNPLSSDYIDDYSGIITYEASGINGDVDTEVMSSVQSHYEYELLYTITSNEDATVKNEYEITFIVKERPIFTSEGYPYEGVSYEISNEKFSMIETRFDLFEGIPADGLCMSDVCVIIGDNKNFVIAYGTDGSKNLGGAIPLNHWMGKYTHLKDNIYHVTELQKYILPENELHYVPVGSEIFEAYFILSSLDEDGKLYYFMEYPENGYNEDMNYFQMYVSPSSQIN